MQNKKSSRRLLPYAAAGLAILAIVGWRAFNNADQDAKVVASSTAVGAPVAGASDWVMYGGTLSRNFVNPKVKGIPAKWSVEDKENIKWSADLGSKSYGGPIIAGGKVFVGTNNQKPRDKNHIDKTGKPIDLGVVACFNEPDGKFLWQTVFTKLPAGRVHDWPLEGICSTPCVEGDRAYFVSNRCEVVCCSVSKGEIIWKLDMIKELGVFPHNIAAGSPMVVGNDLFVVTANGVDEGHINVPAPKAPSFIKVDKRDGKVLWQDSSPTIKLTQIAKAGGDNKDEKFFKNMVNRGDLIQHGQWSNPSYGMVAGLPQVIFPGGDGWIYSFHAQTGDLIWKFDCNPKDSAYELQGKGTRNDFIATPVVYKDRVYIAVGQDPEHETGVGHLWCIDMSKKGDVSPELVTDASVFPPKTKPNPNSAQVWHYGGPIEDPAVRRKLQRNHYFGRTMSSCAIHEDLVYIADLGGTLFCFDANNGKLHWSHDTGAMTWSSPYYVDGKVFMGNDAGVIYCFAHGKKKEILAENEMEGRVRATPVAANGVLYVMTENRLFAIEEKK